MSGRHNKKGRKKKKKKRRKKKKSETRNAERLSNTPCLFSLSSSWLRKSTHSPASLANASSMLDPSCWNRHNRPSSGTSPRFGIRIYLWVLSAPCRISLILRDLRSLDRQVICTIEEKQKKAAGIFFLGAPLPLFASSQRPLVVPAAAAAPRTEEPRPYSGPVQTGERGKARLTNTLIRGVWPHWALLTTWLVDFMQVRVSRQDKRNLQTCRNLLQLLFPEATMITTCPRSSLLPLRGEFFHRKKKKIITLSGSESIISGLPQRGPLTSQRVWGIDWARLR